jgi:hypothetical protein
MFYMYGTYVYRTLRNKFKTSVGDSRLADVEKKGLLQVYCDSYIYKTDVCMIELAG